MNKRIAVFLLCYFIGMFILAHTFLRPRDHLYDNPGVCKIEKAIYVENQNLLAHSGTFMGEKYAMAYEVEKHTPNILSTTCYSVDNKIFSLEKVRKLDSDLLEGFLMVSLMFKFILFIVYNE